LHEAFLRCFRSQTAHLVRTERSGSFFYR
jgi:hypothetical protein